MRAMLLPDDASIGGFTIEQLPTCIGAGLHTPCDRGWSAEVVCPRIRLCGSVVEPFAGINKVTEDRGPNGGARVAAGVTLLALPTCG